MEPIEGSETSAVRTQTRGNYPKENILHKEHGECLKSRNKLFTIYGIQVFVAESTISFPSLTSAVLATKKTNDIRRKGLNAPILILSIYLILMLFLYLE
jgi:hypothetical protein